ncbi:Firmicu-CTERM sorting domain-containing protein [Anaerosporobacter sp.]|uniref:Firmicu-CTERM sorting domain-containing protein n=1 Tax=Anaerosporobacter sp. TaxID=1872529 RepID=UPI00286F379A|nr:Firmicu-CTERM sorting domain-containing protein [Anaerosporobacter sp.]
MKKSVSIICSVLLLTFAIAVPIYATANQSIQIDGVYSDWRHIPHTDISWYSPDPNQVHQGALYLEEDILYGHFEMNDAYSSPMVISYIELTINNSTSIGLTIQKSTADENIDWGTDMYKLPVGTTDRLGVFYNEYPKYYMGEAALTIYDADHLIGDEVEFAIDLNVVSKITDIPVEAMRVLKVYNPNIGRDAITIAGTSSGAVVGVAIMVVIAINGIITYKRGKSKCIR